MPSHPSSQLHTVLGAGGAIATEITRELAHAGLPVRVVSRQPHPGGFESRVADLSDRDQTRAAIAGSHVVHLCVGLKYDIAVWREQWPPIMRNVIEACAAEGARLVFFDNVYMYGRVNGVMTEGTPYHPCSRKGELRARLATQLMDAARAGDVTALIARSADFYGPACRTSLLNLLVLDRLRAGKRAWWFRDDRPRHSFTFTVDAGRAVVRLATEESAYGQIWHLPTAKPAPTGREWIEYCARATGQPGRRTLIPKLAVGLLGMFDTTMREMREMLYQNDADYVFDSTKIEKAFDLTATEPQVGVNLSVRNADAASGEASTRSERTVELANAGGSHRRH